jgi:hypothetical protein
MPDSSPPSHLPGPFPDEAAYERAYEFVRNVRDVYHGDPDDWRETRIPAGRPAEEVYRTLPIAPDFEYAGYLTRTRIRYAEGWTTGGRLLANKACTFHTHPGDDPHGDLPSFTDLYTFLRYTHLRHVTAGRSLIWSLDKSMETLAAVDRLNAWEARHQVEAFGRFGLDHYAEVALGGVGFRLPKNLRQYEQVWPSRVKEVLGVKVTVMDRRPR